MTLAAHLAAEWHPTKNGDLRPRDVTAGSKKKVWWQRRCSEGQPAHEWVAAVYARSKGNGCAICNNRQVQVGVNDLATTCPDLAREYAPDNELPASAVTAGYRTKVTWVGAGCGHRWEASPQQRARSGSGCPACSASGGRAIPGVNDFATTHPELVTEWHPDNTKSPSEVTAGSKFKARWVCAEGHEWVSQVSGRASQGTGCPFCSGQQPIVGVNDLKTLRPDLYRELHATKNTGDGIDVSVLMPRSQQHVWWLGACAHTWSARTESRTRGAGCPTCDAKVVEPGFNDLATTHPHLLASWHPTKNTGVSPTAIAAGAGRRAWWLCDKGHSWEAYIYRRSAGDGCPTCARRRSRIELAFLDLLGKHLPAAGSVRLPVTWVSPANRTYKTAEADIVLSLPGGRTVIVEYDGERYHREKVPVDIAKTEAILAAGHVVVRIRETPLPDLPLVHPRLHQVVHTNGDPLEPTVDAILGLVA